MTTPSGGIFQGDSVPRGPGGPINGGLWDIKTYDVTNLLTPNSTNSLNVTMLPVSDALALINLAVDLPAGSAPPPTPIPEPTSTLALLSFGAVGVGSIIKRKRQYRV